MSGLHPIEPFDRGDLSDRCTSCGEGRAAHRTDLREYTVRWRAVVAGEREAWGSSAAEARRDFLKMSPSALDFEISQYDTILDTPSGRLLRITSVRPAHKRSRGS